MKEGAPMKHPVTGIDHCFLLVEDLDRSLEQFERMGFLVSPRGFHSEAMGSANHTMVFPDDYFELLGMIAETPSNARHRAHLARSGEGLTAIACRAGDVAEAGRKLADLGISTSDARDFERPVPLPGGGHTRAAFSTLQFDPSEVPVGVAFMCQHHTPEAVWIPELLKHPNGAIGLAGLIASVDGAQGAAEGYARLFAAGKVVPVEDGWQVETGSAPITFLPPDAIRARYEGIDFSKTPKGAFAVLQIVVEDLPRAKDTLSKANVTILATARGIAVPPQEASGAVVEFVPANR